MCQICVDAVKRLLPNFTEGEQAHVLWNATCFPFGSPQQVVRQLERWEGFTNVEAIDWIVCREMDRVMDGIEKRRILNEALKCLEMHTVSTVSGKHVAFVELGVFDRCPATIHEALRMKREQEAEEGK